MAKCGLMMAGVIVLMALGATGSAQDVDGDALIAVSNSNLDFTNSLYKKLSRQEGNVFFSPLSIQTILTLTAQGAGGTTAQEMQRGLHLPQDQQTTRSGFRQLISSLQAHSNVTLKIANNIFTSAAFPVNPQFSTTAKNDFSSQNTNVDFKQKPDESRITINRWVEDNTDHKIKNLLPEGSIKSNTAMVLVNAVYFKGSWETKFEPKYTKPKPFSISAEVNREVPMMQLTSTGKFRYKDSTELDAQVLEIPYVDTQVSMVILLPKQKNGIAGLESKLANIHFSNVTARGMSRPKVHLTLPKFKIEKTLDMQEVLEQMGMPKMFTDLANFSGITYAPLKISKVAHKAFMEVTEEGTVAAAATAVVSVTRSERVYPEIFFKADHPFIFFLTSATPNDENKKTVLFMGRYSHP